MPRRGRDYVREGIKELLRRRGRLLPFLWLHGSRNLARARPRRGVLGHRLLVGPQNLGGAREADLLALDSAPLVTAIDQKKAETNLFELVRGLSRELDRLDARDFDPAARFDFVTARETARTWAAATSWGNPGKVRELAAKVAALVAKYGARGKGTPRVFKWLKDADLKTIVERDYAELSNLLLPDGAWKSTVVMPGSILEAILFDLLTKDATRLATAQASGKAPKNGKTGQPIPVDDWTLHDMIEIGTDIALIPANRAKTFDQVLRDYRNFVHPKKEIRSAHPCGEGEALMAKGALDAVCDHFDRMFP